MDYFAFTRSSENTATEDATATLRQSSEPVKYDTGTNWADWDIPQVFHPTPPMGGIDDWGC
jgi:hypothetical protein